MDDRDIYTLYHHGHGGQHYHRDTHKSHRIADIETQRDVGHEPGNHNVQADHKECVLRGQDVYVGMTCLVVCTGKDEYIYGGGGGMTCFCWLHVVTEYICSRFIKQFK